MIKQKKSLKPAGGKLSILRQVCNYIPPYLVPLLSRATGAEDKARSYSSWSHVVAMLYAQLTHALGLNDVCDALRLHAGPLSAIRGARPPSRNGLSHANKVRPAELAEQLFWKMFEHLGNLSPGFNRTERVRAFGAAVLPATIVANFFLRFRNREDVSRDSSFQNHSPQRVGVKGR